MTRTACHHCQHTTSLRLREEFRRTAGGHTEADGKTVVCGACGDSWHFRDRVQLPEWLPQEPTNKGLLSSFGPSIHHFSFRRLILMPCAVRTFCTPTRR